MRLIQVTATNYRCISDSGPVEIGDVTCLVGKNESGKTAFLQALRRLNPSETADGFFWPRTAAAAVARQHDWPATAADRLPAALMLSSVSGRLTLTICPERNRVRVGG
jgi:predicted ATP-binding protein involved in virulence